MKKFGYVVAALAAIAIAVPSIASAETVVIKRGGHHHDWDRARAEYRIHRDNGWHRGWHHRDRDRVVIQIVATRSHRQADTRNGPARGHSLVLRFRLSSIPRRRESRD